MSDVLNKALSWLRPRNDREKLASESRSVVRQVLAESQDKLNPIYEYFRENFLWDPNSFPIPDEFLYILLTFLGRGDGYHYITGSEKEIFAIKEASDRFFASVYDGQESGTIPPSVYNYIFLIEEPGIKLAVSKFLKQAINRYMNPIGRQLDQKETDFVIQNILAEFRKRPTEKLSISKILEFTPYLRDLRNKALKDSEKFEFNVRKDNRKKAIREIDSAYKLSWRENKLALDDKEMSALFFRKDERHPYTFLTTYFDSASFALSSRIMDRVVEHIENVTFQRSFEALVEYYKARILEILEPRFSRERFTQKITGGGIPANLFFTHGGMEAAELLLDNFLTADSRVMMSQSQEYGKIVDHIKKRLHKIHSERIQASDGTLNKDAVNQRASDEVTYNIVEMPKSSADRKKFKRDMIMEIISNNVNVIFASDYGRLGNRSELEIFREICDGSVTAQDGFPEAAVPEISRALRRLRIKLIVDACQTIGRKEVNYDLVNPDAIIASCQKGFELNSKAAGFLVLSDSMLEVCDKDSLIQKGKEIDKGSKDEKLIIDPVIACAPNTVLTHHFEPEELQGATNEQLRKIFASVHEREEAIKSLAFNFANLIGIINADCDNDRRLRNRIHILNPDNSDIYIGPFINEKALTCTFECAIEGVNRDTVRSIAEKFGVYIGNLEDGSYTNHSFRITFHPFMNLEAIKILGYVLKICSDPALMFNSRI